MSGRPASTRLRIAWRTSFCPSASSRSWRTGASPTAPRRGTCSGWSSSEAWSERCTGWPSARSRASGRSWPSGPRPSRSSSLRSSRSRRAHKTMEPGSEVHSAELPRGTAVTGPSRLPRGGTQDVFFPRTASSDMPTIVGGDGIPVIDDRGRRLLDVASGPFLANLGQGNERVLQAMLEQGRRLTYTYSRTTRHAANAKLTEQLAALAGPGFERVPLTSGGSEAVEMALKFLRQHAVANGQPERHRVISMLPGYHGATTQTLGLNGDLAAPALWGPLTVPSEKIPAPLTFRAESAEAAAAASIAALEDAILRLGAEQVLAFVMEPIGGAGAGGNGAHAA